MGMYFDAVLRSFKKWSTSKNLIYWSNSWQLNPWQWSFTFWTARVRWWCGLFKEIILVFICTSSILIIICKCQWHGSYKICFHLTYSYTSILRFVKILFIKIQSTIDSSSSSFTVLRPWLIHTSMGWTT